MKTSDFYYELPQELIAQDPLEDRSSSRLMLLNKETGTFLISLNPKYKPIPVTDLSDFKIFGKLAF